MGNDTTNHAKLITEIDLLKQEVEYLRNILKLEKEKSAEVKEKKAEKIQGLAIGNDALFRSFMNASPDVLTITDLEGKIEFSSPSAAKMFGNENIEAFEGHNLLEFIDEKDHPRTIANIQKMIQGGTLGAEEYTALKADGIRFEIEVNGEFIYDDEGNKVKMVFITRDITRRHQLEEKLHAINEKNRLMLQSINDVVYEIDAEGRGLYISPVIGKLTGFEPEEFTGKRLTDFVYHDDKPALEQALNDMANPPQSYYEFRLRTKDGSLKWFRVSTNPVFKNGKLAGGFGSMSDISEIKKALEDLRNGDEKYRMLIDVTPDPVMITKNFDIVQSNKAARDFLLEYENKTPISKFEPWRLSPEKQPDGQLSSEKAFKAFELANTKGFHRFEWLLVNKYGEQRWMDVTIAKLSTSEGINYYNVWRDITESKRNELELKKREYLHNEAQKLAKLGHWEYDLVNNILTWSDEVYRIFEVDPAINVISYELFLNLIHPDDRNYVNEAFTGAINTGKPYDLVHRLLMKSGKIKYVNEQCIFDFDENGKALRAMGTVMDITKQYLASEELNHFKKATEFATYGISINSLLGETIYLNNAFAEMHGYKVSELEGKNLTIFHNQEQLSKVKELVDLLQTRGSFLNQEVWHTRKDGTVFPTLMNGTIILDDQGKPAFMSATCSDISHLKKTEEALRRNEENLSFALQIARMGNYEMDVKTNKIIHSDSLLKLFDIDPDDYARNDRVLFHFIDTEHITLLDSKAQQIIETRQGQSIEMKFISPDGQMLWMKNVMEPVIEGDVVKAVKGVLIDITDIKKAHEKLTLSERKYRTIFENIQDTYYEASLDSILLEISSSVGMLSKGQFTREELVGKSFLHLYAFPDQRNAFFEKILQAGKVSDYELMLSNKDGSLIPVAITAQVQFDKNNKPEKITGIIRDITERTLAAKAIAENELKYRTLFETMVQGVVYQDADGLIIEANPAAQEILGLSLDQFQGRTSFDPRWRSVREDFSEFPGDTHPAMVALKTGKPVYNAVMGVFHPLKNHYRWININAVPQFRNQEDKPYRVFTTFEDITETKLAQLKLEQSEENLNLSQEIAKMGSWELNMETFETSWSKNYYQILGYQPFEVDATHEMFLSHVHPDDRYKIDDFHEKILTTRKPTIMEIRMIRRDGTIIWIENNILPVFEGDKLKALKGSNIDITNKKENEMRIRHQNEKLNAIISALPDILFVFDKEGNYLELFTKPGHELLSQSSEIINTNIRDHFSAEDAEFHLGKIRECLLTRSVIEYEYPIIHEHGTAWFEARLAAMENDQAIAFVRAITDRKKAELEIKKLSLAVSQSPVMVMITGLKGEIEYVNQAFLDTTGYTEEEILGRNPRIMKSGKTDPSVYQDMWKTIKAGKTWSSEWINKKKNNELYWEEIAITPILNDKGETLNYLAIKQDITSRKRFEKQLQELNKNLEQKVKARTEELALKNETLLSEIAERKIVYDALLLSESRLELAMEAARMAWWEMNIKTGTVVFHRRKTDMLGWTFEKFNHYNDFMDLVHPDDRKRAYKAMHDHIYGKVDRYETEYRIKKQTGTYLWYLDIGRVSKRDENGSPLEVVGFVSEITQRKNIELALTKKTRELENFFSVSLELLCIADLNGNFIKVNKSWSELLDYPLHELEQRQFLDFVHPDDIPATLEAMRHLNTSNPIINFVNRYKTRSGEYRYIEWHATPVGKILYAAARDITDSKFISDFQKDLLGLSSKLAGLPSNEIDRALKEAVQRIGQFLDADRSYIFEFDPEITLMSNTYEYCAPGITTEIEHLKNLPIDLFPKLMEVMRSHKNVVIPSVENLDDEWKTERETFIAQQIKSIILIPIFSENMLMGFAGLDYVRSKKEFKDATIQMLQIWSTMLAGLINNMRIESLLEQSRQNYETFFNTIDDFLFVYDMQGRIVHVNDTVISRLGYTFNQLKDHTISVIYPPAMLDEANSILEKFLNNELTECSLPFYTKSGETILAESKLKQGSWNGKPIIFMVGKDISQIKLSEEKFSKAFHSNFAAMAISTYEENSRFVDVNNTFLKILGYHYDEVIGKTSEEVGFYTDPADKEKIGRLMRKNETIRDVEVKYGTKAGVMQTGLFSSDVVYIGNEKRYLTALVDITERKKMESELIAARIEADEANKAKSEFLSRMSHELRTPMNSILGFAQLLEMSELNQKQMKGVKHILSSGKHLLDLINEVLDISRIESGRLSLSLEPVQLGGLITEMIDLVIPQVRARDLSIRFVSSQHNDRFVKTDSQRMKQVMLNLINNAIKYNTEKGEIIIEVSSVKHYTSGDEFMRIAITDTGIGISEINLKKLFTPFERIGADKLMVEGTGLGLTVVKKLVEAMGGTVDVHSTEGHGSTFWIDLPAIESQMKHALNSGEMAASKPNLTDRKGTILYVEDNTSNIELVEQLLNDQRSGITLIAINYGNQALGYALEYAPDLILLDVNLPDTTGDAVLKELKEDERTRKIPVVILSADALPRQVSRLLKAGAMEYLTKPIEIVAFLEIIDEVMQKKEK